MASDLIERLTNPEATEQLIGMVSYEASTWRVEPNRERDAVEEAGFLDAVAHTLEALRTALAIERERAEKAEVRRNAHHEGELHAIERAKAAEAALAEARRLLKPFADFAEKAERFVQGRADFGGDPVRPVKDFRLHHFKDAARFLAHEEGRPIEEPQR